MEASLLPYPQRILLERFWEEFSEEMEALFLPPTPNESCWTRIRSISLLLVFNKVEYLDKEQSYKSFTKEVIL